jgi:hypothetical protein
MKLLTKGLVYVISTKTYFEQNIFKIGFTKCIKSRLKQFNNTRTTEDHYFLCYRHDTVSYKKLEAMIHEELDPYKLNNELFQLPLSAIEDTIKNIVRSGFFNHKDVVFDNACLYNLFWSKNIWVITLEDDLQVFLNNDRLIDYIKEWLKPYDTLNLYRFISDDYYGSLLHFLRTYFIERVQTEHPHIKLLSDLLLDMSLDSKCTNDIDISMQKLKLEK